MSLTQQSCFSLLTIGCLLHATAAPVSIGVIRSPGEVRVDGSLIRGNGTLFDGSMVETSDARSDIQLADGARVTLTPESRATVYHDRTVLEQGVGVVRNAEGRVVDARTLQVSSAGKDSVLQIEMSRPGHVVVAARIGAAEVRTASGLLVARVAAGTALDFDPQSSQSSSAAPPVKMTGCLVNQGGVYLLTDQTSRTTIELQGSGLARYNGNRIEVTGSVVPNLTPVGGADQVVLASNVKSLGPCSGKPSSPAAAAGRGGAAGKAAGGAAAGAGIGIGLSGAAIGAIAGGVAVAGTVTGLAASGSFSGGSKPASPQ
jgi:hypothetical protein